jgi:diacylglycerol kinase (ATP)
MPSSRDEADVILLIGGDGTIHRHLAQLVKLALPVLIAPAGSGNDFARALGILSSRDSLSAWKQFCAAGNNLRRIDLGVITTPADEVKSNALPRGASRYFGSIAGVGIDGEVARRANKLPRWLRAHGGYVLGLAASIFQFAPLPMKVLTADGEGWTTRSNQPTILAAFANTPAYGGGMKIAPRAKLDDGLLDVCVVGGVGRLKLLSMFPSVYGGHHLNIREVEYFQSPRSRIEAECPLPVYADGEYVCETPAEISIEPGALTVLVPGN